MKNIISFSIRKIPRRYLQLFSHFILRALGIFYAGNKVECPVCGNTYRNFFPYGRNPVRENALCFHCLSLERHRLLWLYLKDKTNFFTDPLKVLHIAPELCYIRRFESQDNLDYITADLESPLAKVKMDVHAIPFADNEFDVAICNHVMEHVNDDILAMKEILRVLKPGGWAIIQSPLIGWNNKKTFEDASITSPAEREKVYGQRDHVRLYGQDYPERLRSAGFRVTEDDFVKKLPAETLERYSLPKEEIIYLCVKP